MLAARLVRLVARIVAGATTLSVGVTASCGAGSRDTPSARPRQTAVSDERVHEDAGRPAGLEAAFTDGAVGDAGPRFGFSAASWMKVHGVTAPLDVDACDYEAAVGEPPLPLIVCSTHRDASNNRVVYRRTIYAAERGELRCVFDAAMASGRREPYADGDADGGSDPYNVKLDFSMAADGTITLRDSADRGCSAAAAAKRRDEAADKVCAARGVYVWKESRFARATPGSRVDERRK